VSLVASVSDIHIGNGAPTVWYQQDAHEAKLIALLDWVVDSGVVSELVLGGDVFDLWTYPPSVCPPSVSEIVAANPNTLGPSGALARASEALGGAVTLLLGNHDGTLDQEALAALRGAIGPFTFIEDGVYVVTGATGARTVFAHGHYWTMFNAPDPASKWPPLPVGHFVTRAFAHRLTETLQPGQTAADLEDMGYPNGFDLSAFLRSLFPSDRQPFEVTSLNPGIASMLLSYVAAFAGMDENMPITLPDGSVTSITEAKQVYADLFTQWQDREGVLNAARAAFADNWAPYLTWFAQRLALEQNADLVVLGHTHSPVSGVHPSPISYINSGFECPSLVDQRVANNPKAFTFSVVDTDAATGQIWTVTDANGIEPYTAPFETVLPSPTQDYSCYVTILNQTANPLALSSAPGPTHGYWAVAPPATIPAEGRGRMWVQDYPGLFGTEATVTYNGNLNFSFSCPYVGFNRAAGPGGHFDARSGDGDWSHGSVPKLSYPLQVRFTVA
jgi:hypothetical protein